MTMTKLPALPSLSRGARRNKPVVPCKCGCGMGTKGTWYPGHDGRATGWATRIERGMLTLEDVPANERAGAAFMLERRGKVEAAALTVTRKSNKERKAERRTAKAAAANVPEVPEVNVEPVVEEQVA